MDKIKAMKKTDCVMVYTLWQGTVDVHAARCNLRVTDPMPIYTYQQHGRTRIASEPLYQVEFWSNDGRETGAASYRELIAAGVNVPAATWVPPGGPKGKSTWANRKKHRST